MAAAWEETTTSGPRLPYYQVIDGAKRCAWLVPERFRESQKFRPGAGDIVQSTYPKCGTHWVLYITQLILKEGKEPVRDYAEFASNTRALGYWELDGWKPKLPMRSYYSHQPLCRQTMSMEGRYVYIARNPWDVCVSFYHMASNVNIWRFQDGTFDEFVDAFIEGEFGYGSYFDHVAAGYALRNEPNVFFLTYEGLKKDTRGTVLRLARFLGDKYVRALEESEDLLQNILKWSTPEFMRDKVVFDFSNQVDAWDELFARSSWSVQEGLEGDKTKLSIVRKAKVGGWKEHFTPHQLERLEKKIRDEGEKASFMELFKDIREEALALSSIST